MHNTVQQSAQSVCALLGPLLFIFLLSAMKACDELSFEPISNDISKTRPKHKGQCSLLCFCVQVTAPWSHPQECLLLQITLCGIWPGQWKTPFLFCPTAVDTVSVCLTVACDTPSLLFGYGNSEIPFEIISYLGVTQSPIAGHIPLYPLSRKDAQEYHLTIQLRCVYCLWVLEEAKGSVVPIFHPPSLPGTWSPDIPSAFLQFIYI